MSIPTTYKHCPITSPRNIRILHIEPTPRAPAGLRCYLKQVCLDDDPIAPYSALSYCWEGQLPDCPITCDGEILKVTKNCMDAMTKLRGATDTTSLWIDSVCIDQTNIEEKSGQVALMGEIYKNADKVIVWLGEWDDKMRKAVEIVKDLDPLKSLGGLDNTNSETGSTRNLAKDHAKAQAAQQQIQAKVRALKAGTTHPSDDVLGFLFHRPWFSRMWTVQEVALARGNNVVIYNGPHATEQLSWSNMILGIDALTVGDYQWVDLSRTVALHKNLLLMITLIRFPMMKAVYNMKQGDLVREPMVWPIMCDAREKESTDDKDKVLALYSVFQELKIARTLPAPDYSKSTEDVYRELTIACIESDKWLYVLLDAPSDRRHARPNLASWVPDWSDPGWRGKGNIDSRIALARDRFCAAGSAEPFWAFSANGRHLHLRAKVIDEIIFCAEAFCCLSDQQTFANMKDPRNSAASNAAADHYKADLREAYDTFKAWTEICNWYEQYPSTGETIRQAFCRTLTQDSHDENSDPETDRQAATAWFDIMSSPNPDIEVFRARYATQFGISDKDDATVKQLLEKLPRETTPSGALTMQPGGKFHSAAMMFSNRKGFFVTAGGLMGTAAARVEHHQDSRSKAVNLVQEGDQVAAVAGLAMPMILRPVKDEDGMDIEGEAEEGKGVYRLVTHAYVHGIMYGEAWEDALKDVEEIILV